MILNTYGTWYKVKWTREQYVLKIMQHENKNDAENYELLLINRDNYK